MAASTSVDFKQRRVHGGSVYQSTQSVNSSASPRSHFRTGVFKKSVDPRTRMALDSPLESDIENVFRKSLD
jgi:hypothetical protein